MEAGTWDVVIAGAGPAGSATALLLAQRGMRVALLERSHFAEARVGESLSPSVQPLLRALGVWDAFGRAPQVAAYGCMSVWGDAQPQVQSYMSSQLGRGYHVERRPFDRMLAAAAESAGAELCLDTTLGRCDREGDGYRVTTHTGRSLRTRVLIDATGRRAHVARQLGGERVLFDRAVAVAAHWPAPSERPLLVEACPPGWFYSAPVSDELQSVMWMTDADLCARMPLTAALQHAPHTLALLHGESACSPVRVHCAHSQRVVHRRAHDPGPYLAVGDAALAVDPIAGNGVARALRSARDAAETVSQMLDAPGRERELLATYNTSYDEQCTRYLLERVQYYAAEKRFDTPYWLRRARAAA